MKMIGDQRLTRRKPRARMWFAATFCFALQLSAANVVTDWNAIASTTIVANGGKSPAASAVWFAYTSLAVYDAVNAITGEYRPFYYQGVGPRDASLEAAAAAAAHRVLVNYFPSQQTALDGNVLHIFSRDSRFKRQGRGYRGWGSCGDGRDRCSQR